MPAIAELSDAELEALRGRIDDAGATLVIIPGINHLWRKAPLDPAANAATYRDARLPIDPAVATAVAAFVRAKR